MVDLVPGHPRFLLCFASRVSLLGTGLARLAQYKRDNVKEEGMATSKNKPPDPLEVIEFRDPPPQGAKYQGFNWLMLLTPLLKHKSRWAMVRAFDTPDQAQSAQSNLSTRAIQIPAPTHDWSFAARGCELFAEYRGEKPKMTRPPRAKAKRKRVARDESGSLRRAKREG